MIQLQIDEIKIESTNNNRRPVLRKKKLREWLITYLRKIERGTVSGYSAVERVIDKCIQSMTMVSDPKYKRSLEALAWHFKAQYDLDAPMKGRLHVLLIIDTFKDADNFKIVCDALELAGVIENDRQIVYYAVAKNVVKMGTPERIRVQIYNADEQYNQKEFDFDTIVRNKMEVPS